MFVLKLVVPQNEGEQLKVSEHFEGKNSRRASLSFACLPISGKALVMMTTVKGQRVARLQLVFVLFPKSQPATLLTRARVASRV